MGFWADGFWAGVASSGGGGPSVSPTPPSERSLTVLQLLNRVLRRLREAPVTALTETEYSALVTEFLIDIHQECLEHDWSSMEHIIDVPVDAGQRVLDITGHEADGGDLSDASRVPNTDSTVIYDAGGRPLAWVFDDDSADSDGHRLGYISTSDMNTLYQQDRDQSTTDPAYFSLRNSPTNDGLELVVFPPPVSARHIRIFMWTPELPIDIDEDTDRIVLVPPRPLYLGAIFLALNERGEEVGEPGGLAQKRYEDAFSAAVEADVNRRSLANRFTAQRD